MNPRFEAWTWGVGGGGWLREWKGSLVWRNWADMEKDIFSVFVLWFGKGEGGLVCGHSRWRWLDFLFCDWREGERGREIEEGVRFISDIYESAGCGMISDF